MLNNSNAINYSFIHSDNNFNYFYNMLTITLLSTLITSMVGIFTELNKSLINFIGNIFKKTYEYFKKITKGKTNQIIIEHKINNNDPKLNNKLLIEAILYDYLNGDNYK